MRWARCSGSSSISVARGRYRRWRGNVSAKRCQYHFIHLVSQAAGNATVPVSRFSSGAPRLTRRTRGWCSLAVADRRAQPSGGRRVRPTNASCESCPDLLLFLADCPLQLFLTVPYLSWGSAAVYWGVSLVLRHEEFRKSTTWRSTFGDGSAMGVREQLCGLCLGVQAWRTG